MFYYEVAPTKVFRSKSDFLTYHSTEPLAPGTIVIIPLGQKSIPGIIWKKVPKPSFPTKPIQKTLYSTPLPLHLLKSLLWLSSYYITPLPTVLQTALPRGLEKTRRKKPVADASTTLKPSNIPLTQAQTKALSDITSIKNNTILLHGITGSGKTNIYLHLTAKELEKGNSTILLTPEIALSSQLVKVFKSHFKDVILLHSEQTESERHLLWEQILSSPTPLVIVGPRSALFAPVKNLGLIIIDEAHEPTYHQDQSPKYSALRLASTMSRTLLGTATPSITDYHLAKTNHALVELSELAIQSDTTATIEVLDLKNRSLFTRHKLLSNPLLSSIETSIQNSGTTLIFHNRRGSAPMTICDHCGWQALCPSCLLPLTLHADQFALLCHTCGSKQKIPPGCPSCHNASILHKGFGTKYLESELSHLFPKAKIARFDADTPDEFAMKNIYQEVHSGAFDIIIGTQMIAKGFDFPHLSTLGVVQADAGLSLPDFSSEERTFQLLSQVIGRANRGHRDTHIFIQTYQPDHPTIQTAITGDFTGFSAHLLAQRRKSHLPPFTYLAKLTLTYKTESTTIKNIQKLRRDIVALTNNKQFLNKNRTFCSEIELKRKGRKGNVSPFLSVSVSAPSPAFHERTPRGYTWQLILKSKSRAHLLSLISQLPPNPHLHLTLDPPTLL